MGQYTQVDPIGLVGGNPTLYGYVYNPFVDIDQFGLKACTSNNQTTILGENMRDRVIPFADRTGASTLPWGTTPEKWARMTPRQRWKLNDGALRNRIKRGDNFRYIGEDPKRASSARRQFDLTRSELLRLEDRGILFEIVSEAEIISILGL